MIWSLEAAALYVAGMRDNKLESRVFGILLFCVAGMTRLLDYDVHGAEATSLFTMHLFCNLVLAANLIATAGMVAAHGKSQNAERLPGGGFLACGLAALYVALLGEVFSISGARGINGTHWLLAAVSVAALLLALGGKVFPVLMEIGGGARSRSMLSVAWLPVFAIPVFMASPFVVNLLALTSLPHGFVRLEVVAWLLFLVAAGFLLSPAAPRDGVRSNLVSGSTFAPMCRAVFCIFAMLLLGHALGALTPDRLLHLLIYRMPLLALLVIVTFAPLPPRVTNFLRSDEPNLFLPVMLCVLVLMQVPTLLFSNGVVLGYYFPFFNLIDLLGLATLLAPLVWICVQCRARNDALLRAGTALWLGAFLWLNFVIARAVHHYAGADYTLAGIFASNYFQSTAAFVWGAVGIGAMMLSFRRGWRLPWIMGAVLVVVDVAKLFLVDLAKVGTLARIVSFIFVGLLLILVGYFAPLPPKRKSE